MQSEAWQRFTTLKREVTDRIVAFRLVRVLCGTRNLCGGFLNLCVRGEGLNRQPLREGCAKRQLRQDNAIHMDK